MKKRLSFVLLLALLLATFALSSASAAGNAEFGIVEMHQSGEEITMYLTRYNGEWNPDNRTYTKEQYSVNMGDAKPEITSVQSLGEAGGDIHYILLVDISASIKGKEPAAVNEALQHFYEGLKDNEYVTLIPFGDSGQNIVIREQKKSQISEWPAQKFNNQLTHMYEAIVTGAQVYESNPDKYARTAMIMITDGTDDYTNGKSSKKNEDHYTFEQAAEYLANANVPFYAMMFTRSTGNEGNQADVQQMAESTYGSALVVDTVHLTEKLTSLCNITRNSTVVKLPLVQDPKKLQSGIQPTEFTVDLSNVGKTSPRVFNVDWSKVNTVLDAYLDKLEVRDINEDNTEIRVTTEPGATVRFTLNNTQKEVPARANGEAVWSVAKEGVQLKPGDKIEIYAWDEYGNDTFEQDSKNGKKQENPITVTVSESSLEQIVVTVPEDVLENGLSGEKLSFMIHGQPSEEVEITWSADSDAGPITQIIPETLQNNGDLNVNLSFADVNGTNVEKVTGGNLVVNYKNGKGASKVGRSKGSIVWSRSAPVVKKEIAIEIQEITEDDDALVVNTEPGADVTVRRGGREVYSQQADASGEVIWNFGDGDRPSAGDVITATASYEFGSNTPSARITVGESPRRQISVVISQDASVSVPQSAKREGAIFGENLAVTITGERNQPVVITWEADGVETKVFEEKLKQNGVLERTLSFDELNGSDWGTIQNGSLSVSYQDGKGRSKEGYSTPVTWTRKPPVEEDTTVDPVQAVRGLTEDTEEWTLKTEPDATVTVDWGNGAEPTVASVDPAGDVRLSVPAGLKEDDQVVVTARDAKGNVGEPTVFIVGKTKRADIQVDPVASPIQDNQIKVSGRAEKNTDIRIVWTPESGSTPVSHTETVSAEGLFTTVFTNDDCEIGPGYLTVEYEDGRGASKTKAVDGVVSWYSPTPEPTPTPTPIPETPAPSEAVEEVAPEPEPTTEPGFIEKVKTWVADNLGSGTDMLRNPKFWLMIVSLLLIIALIVWLILTLVRRVRNKRNDISSLGSVEGSDAPRDSENPNSGLKTTRAGGIGDPKKTQIKNEAPIKVGSETRVIDPPKRPKPGEVPGVGAGTGTVRLGVSAQPPVDGGTKTVRIDVGPKPLEMTLEESHEFNGSRGERKVAIIKDITIGRSSEATVKIDDETVSSKHLKIERDGDMLFVTDNNSSNGTKLNDEKLTVRRPLKDGDRLVIGRTTLIVHYKA